MNCTISKCKILGVWNGACKGGVVNSEHFVLWTGWTISLKFVSATFLLVCFLSLKESPCEIYISISKILKNFNFKN